ncbi:MAG: M23 family metallopeptidase [Desulfuromonadales bacterium]|nr:M23 family metallopeptidase [Desulfuromonadales bacterium]
MVKKFDSQSSVGSKGIEITASSGTPVSSAAAGKVIYSGDGISGYGNLLIVRHDDSFFTVYGYNKKNLVQTGAFVSKGEKIALSGQPPAGGAPRVYFEIRYGKKPVNPLSYLP